MTDDANLPAQWAKEDSSHLEARGIAGDPDDYSQPFLIYADRRQAIRKLNKRMLILLPFFLFYCFLVASAHMWIIAALLIAQYVGMYLWVVRRFNKNVTPLIQLDATGITVHGLITHLHMDWDNLQEVRAYSFAYKFIGMDAKNIWKLKASLPMKLFLSYNKFIRFFYRLVGIKLHGINVPEQYAHFKAEEICEHIEKRRDYYLRVPTHEKALQALAQAKSATSEPDVKLVSAEPVVKSSTAEPDATLKLPSAEEKIKLPSSEN